MPEMLECEFCVVSFHVAFPPHRLVSEKYRGKVLNVTYDGEFFRVLYPDREMPKTAEEYGRLGSPKMVSEELSRFDRDFAELCFRHSGAKDYYDAS